MLKRKRLFCAILVLMMSLSLVLTGCGSSSETSASSETESATGTRTVTDMSGVEVEIPAEVNTYVESWFAHNAVIVMLDKAEGCLVTCADPEVYTWMYHVCDNMSNAEFATFSEDMNLEEIIAKSPDVVFGSNEAYREMFENVGIPFVNCTFSNYEEMQKSILLTAEVLGEDAQKIADEYVSYLSEKLDSVAETVSVVSEADKKTVAHGHNMYEFDVDGANTIINEWIEYAGGINAAADDIDGNNNTTSIEQLLVWDPDVLIMAEPDAVESIMTDSAWADLTAVKNGDVYCAPSGIFYWDRYGVEEALQFQWTAKVLYPELFEDLNMVEEVQNFYKKFYGYDLSAEDAQRILDSEDPE